MEKQTAGPQQGSSKENASEGPYGRSVGGGYMWGTQSEATGSFKSGSAIGEGKRPPASASGKIWETDTTRSGAGGEGCDTRAGRGGWRGGVFMDQGAGSDGDRDDTLRGGKYRRGGRGTQGGHEE